MKFGHEWDEMVRTTNPALQERLDTLVRLANENNVDEVRPWAG